MVGGVAALLLMIERAKNRPVRKLPPFSLPTHTTAATPLAAYSEPHSEAKMSTGAAAKLKKTGGKQKKAEAAGAGAAAAAASAASAASAAHAAAAHAAAAPGIQVSHC
jgi:hypothetical protein